LLFLETTVERRKQNKFIGRNDKTRQPPAYSNSIQQQHTAAAYSSSIQQQHTAAAYRSSIQQKINK
jgi:hypothetical protein